MPPDDGSDVFQAAQNGVGEPPLRIRRPPVARCTVSDEDCDDRLALCAAWRIAGDQRGTLLAVPYLDLRQDQATTSIGDRLDVEVAVERADGKTRATSVFDLGQNEVVTLRVRYRFRRGELPTGETLSLSALLYERRDLGRGVDVGFAKVASLSPIELQLPDDFCECD